MKLKIIFLFSAFILFLNLAGCGVFSKKYTKQETTETIIQASGKIKLSLENSNGSIKVFKSSDTAAIRIKAHKEIRVRKKYLDTPFEEIEVKIDTTGETVNITTEINKRKGEFIKFDINRGPSVDYEIWLPESIEIAINNVNGNISAGTLVNDISIWLVNGDVDLEKASGNVLCEIINGNFNAGIDSTKGIAVKIVNGRATLMLGSFLSADFDVSTVNGSINEEQIRFYDLNKAKKKLRGKTGLQNDSVAVKIPMIKVETINGKINLFGKTEI